MVAASSPDTPPGPPAHTPASDVRVAQLAAQVENLHRKAEHAAVIEQAKGVLMGGMGCGPDAAFAILVAQSQMQNRKLYLVAADLVSAQKRNSTCEAT